MSTPEDTREHGELIERILLSAPFLAAPNQGLLLRFLLKKSDEFLPAKQIETDHFKRAGNHQDPAHSRERISDLKARLEAYASSAKGERWKCDLPDSKRGEGYRLRFEPITHLTGATTSFWDAHCGASDGVLVVINELVFYQDTANNCVIRFFDVNPDHALEDKDKLLALRRRHPDAYKKGLKPYYIYMVSGEVLASDDIINWFRDRTSVKARRSISRLLNSKEYLRSSPVLIGSARTNRYMGKLFDSKRDCGHLSYRFTDAFTSMQILDATDPEREAIARLGYRPEPGKDMVIPKKMSAVSHALGFVTRMAMPGGQGCITILASEYSAVVQQMASALVDEQQMKRILAKAGWPTGQALPASFEWFFAVMIEPGSILHQAGDAEFLGARFYDENRKRITPPIA